MISTLAPVYSLRDCARVAGLSLVVAAVAVSAGSPANAKGRDRQIDVIQVEGLIDPPNVTLVRDAIEGANRDGSTMLLVQINSDGAVGTGVKGLVRAIENSRVPIVVWIGPSGATARGAAALLAEAAHATFAAPSTDFGVAQPVRLDDTGKSSTAPVRAELTRLAESNGRDGESAAQLANHTLSAKAAARAGVTNGVHPTIGETIVNLNNKVVRTAAGEVRMSTAKVIGEGRDRRRQPNQDVVFDSLTLGAQIQHGLISPSLAYFLFVIGFALIVFEFFAASVGFGSVVGGISVIGATYGFSHLPVHWWGVALLLLSAFGFTVDVQAGGQGPWTFVGGAALIAGSLTLYGGSSQLDPAWWIIALVCLSVGSFYVLAMPSFVRSRFSTPAVGREGMIGQLGIAEVPVSPEGVVLIRGARWRAFTNRATPISAGDGARVVAVQGLMLEVEPETGGARDYRDRSPKRTATEDPDPNK